MTIVSVPAWVNDRLPNIQSSGASGGQAGRAPVMTETGGWRIPAGLVEATLLIAVSPAVLFQPTLKASPTNTWRFPPTMNTLHSGPPPGGSDGGGGLDGGGLDGGGSEGEGEGDGVV